MSSPTPHARPGNSILAAIVANEYEQMQSLFTPFPLQKQDVLQQAGEPVEYVYFPISGIISMLTVLENGTMIEFATVGRQGTTGIPALLSAEISNATFVSQVPGEALRMKSTDFLDQVTKNRNFAAAVKGFGALLLALVAQSAACNRAHHTNQRCARWLLMTHDQVDGDTFPVTQEFLAQMLGVSRPSVAVATGTLHQRELIRYRRGQVTITDRPGLERAACECYAAIRQQFDRVAARQAAGDGAAASEGAS